MTPSLPQRTRIYNEFVSESSRWDNFTVRDGDILICTPAKCGTTWTQMICALLIFQKTQFDKALTEHSPWLDVLLAPIDEVLTQLEAQQHRRFIKTHTPLDGLPYFPEARYICVGRDPRDAFISLKHHMENMRMEALEVAAANATHDWQPPKPAPEDPRLWFRGWIASSCSTAEDHAAHADVLHYVNTFWKYRQLPNILMVHYSDLKADLAGEMKRIAAYLDISVPDKLWPELIEAATFTSMKGQAEQLAPQVTDNIWKDPNSFFKEGANGQWREILEQEELELYRKVMDQRLPPDLAQWLEQGRLASGIE